MKAWHLATVGLVCLAAAACRSNPEIRALEVENRNLEDKKFALEDQVRDLEQQLKRKDQTLEKLQRAAEKEKAAGEAPRRRTSPNESEAPPAIRGPQLTPGPESSTSRPSANGPRLDIPNVELPDPSLLLPGESEPPAKPRPSVPPAEPKKLPAESKSARTLPEERRFDPAVVAASAVVVENVDSSRVAKIALDQRATGGRNLDHRPGDDGVCMLIQPRDAEGRAMTAAAPISVVALDPGLPGEAARYARWDLTAEQAAQFYRRGPQGEGFWLELPWPKAPPLHQRLHLFARYTTSDGRKLEADREIDVVLPGRTAHTPAQANSSRPAWSAER
jgi:hypothetical protein